MAISIPFIIDSKILELLRMELLYYKTKVTFSFCMLLWFGFGYLLLVSSDDLSWLTLGALVSWEVGWNLTANRRFYAQGQKLAPGSVRPVSGISTAGKTVYFLQSSKVTSEGKVIFTKFLWPKKFHG